MDDIQKKIDKQNVQDLLSLTPMQEGMLFHYLENPDSTTYLEQLSLYLSGEVDLQFINKAWNYVVESNEMLRTVFRWEKLPKPMQIILKEYQPPIRYYDLTKLDNSEKEKKVIAIRESDHREGINIIVEPFRITVIQLNDYEVIMIICNHHILFDGWSNGIILKEFFQAYSALCDGLILTQSNKKSFKKFVKWLQSQDLEVQRQYWIQYLQGVEMKTMLPENSKNSTQQNNIPKIGQHNLLFNQDITNRLHLFVTANRITAATVFYTVWGFLLQRYNNTNDVVFGTTVSGRSGAIKGLEEMVGLFINTIPLRVRANFDESILAFLKDIDQGLKERTIYENIPLVDIKSCSGIDPQEALFDSIVVIENYPLDKQLNEMENKLKIKSYSIVESTHFDLTLSVEMNEQIQIQFSYNQFVFSKQLIQELSKYFCNILNYIIEKPHKKISEITMLTAVERDRLLYTLNEISTENSKDKIINQLFEEQVKKTPDQIAVVYEDQQLTYQELNEKANSLAWILRDKGVQADQIVGLMCDRSLEMMVGIVSILKAGGAYMPISPDYPQERIQYMMENSQANILLVQGKLVTNQLVHSLSTSIDMVDLDDHILYSGNLSNLNTLSQPDHLAYAIYTSGSTGKPKGVMIEQKSVVSLVAGLSKIIYERYEPQLKVALVAPYYFDASVQQIFAALLLEHTLCIVPEDTRLDGRKLLEFYQQHEIQISDGTPVHISLLANTMKTENEFELLKMKHLIIGGEALPSTVVNDFFVRFNPYKLLITNIYGPTECCVDSTAYLIDPEQLDRGAILPIGTPLPNEKIYILGQNGEVLPSGAIGEVHISGEGVSRGYLNNPELTAERFVDNPFVSGSRMYRTGDLARWLPDGNLEFLGRSDHQVKIRGFRIELGEIENQLSSFEALTEAIVIVKEDQEGTKYLCAYVVPKREVTSKELREYLTKTLPDYMIPSHFISLDQMPITPNGKIDRKALPEPDGLKIGTEYEAPRNDVEERLASIWQEVLGVDQIGINDNFFELGGHSLKATRISGNIHKEFDVEISIKQIFATPTIKGLSLYIQDTISTIYVSIEKVSEKESYETSSAQKRLYMIQQLDLESTGYNMSAVFQLEGKLDLVKVETTFLELIQRHESLRTSFMEMDEKIVQKVHPKIEFNVEYIGNIPTMQGRSKEIAEEPILNVVLEEAVNQFIRPFDLSKAPLFRVGVIQFDENKHYLLFDMHHIISDGTSMAILIDEFARLYEGKELNQLRIQYKDYAKWQNEYLQSETMKRQGEYWIHRFSDEIPVLNLPTDYSRPSVRNLEGDTIRYIFDQELETRLKRIAQETGSTMYMVLLSGLNVLFSKYSGQEDIILGSPIAGRSHIDSEKIMGMFVNTLVMRNHPKGDKRYLEFLKEVRENAFKAYENQDYQFEKLVDELDLNRDLSRNPLFDVMFAMQNMDSREVYLQDLTITPYSYTNKVTKFDLTILANEKDEVITVDIEYSSKLFKRETIERMVSHLNNILKIIVDNSEIKLSEIDMLSVEEKDQLLYEFNDTSVEYPRDKTIHQLFEEQVEKVPDQIALVFKEKKLTYQELNERANCLAKVLQERGIKEDTIVGIMTERSLEMVVGVLAILKAGGAYLPIDPDDPEDRIQFMIDDCTVNVFLTCGAVHNQLELTCDVIDILDETFDSVNSIPHLIRDELSFTISPKSLAYVIYTSGSTGKPKGVMVEHRNVVRLVKNPNYVEFQEGDKILQTGTLAFDASTFEIWGALLNGLELHLGVKDLILSAARMENYIINNSISILWLTAPLMNLMAEERPGMFKTLKYLLSGGDVLSPKHVNRVRSECRDLKMVNGYGPTENTTFSVCDLIDREYTTNIPIGKPISNSTAYIVDNDNNLAPIGVYGELCVGGDGLSRGYVNNLMLTAEKFVENPFIPGEKMYKTGDLVRWLPDGKIEFLGRKDYQVKIRGFRIELGEIEKCLLEFDRIKEVVIIPRKDEKDNKYLCAYVVVHEEITNSEIRSYLAKNIPDYMIPSHFIQLNTMPLNRNGKVDRKALPILEGNMVSGAEYEAPRTKVEEVLVNIWKDVLGIDQVGIQDNFFELGGHSLKATILVGKIHKTLDVEVPLRQIFVTPTIKGMSAYIQSVAKTVFTTIKKVAEKDDYEASSAQKRIYLLQQFDLQSISYNIPGVLKIEGLLEIERVEQAFVKLINRHETLRTSFTTIGEKIVQKINDEVEFAVENLGQTDREIDEVIVDFVRPFNLNKAPLMRVGVIKLERDCHILIFDMHHIISDGISMGILIDEFTALYEGKELEQLRIQYKDYAEWQNKQLQSVMMRKQEAYWLDLFSDDLPVLNLPTDYARPKIQNFAGSTIKFSLDQDLTQNLNRVAQKTGSTLYMVLLSGINILLSKYSGQEDIIVGSPIAGRPHVDLEKIIGMFVNTLVMRNNPAGDKTIEEFLLEVKNNALTAYENQDYQFEALVERLELPRDLSRNPLFDVMFVMQNMNSGQLYLQDLELSMYNYENKTAKFDMKIMAMEVDDSVIFELEYSVKLFKRETIERMISHLKNILKVLVADLNFKLSEIEMLTPEEKTWILEDFNATMVDYPDDQTLQEIFEAQVARNPEQVAVECAGQSLTYSELNEKANRLARTLREKGVTSDSIVGILVERSLEMMVGILGILKAGGAYLPISPEYPKERIKYLLADSKNKLILTQSKFLNIVEFEGEVINLEDVQAYSGNGENLAMINRPQDLAYVIYTSGSTGNPKGVVVEHSSLINTIHHLQQKYPLTESDTILQSTVYTFDASVREIFWWFFSGAKCYLLGHGSEKNPYEIVETIGKEKITMAKFVPVLFQEILKVTEELGIEYLQSLKYLLIGGEALSQQLVRKYITLFGLKTDTGTTLKPRLINVYGPTEATIHCTEYEIRGSLESINVLIGRPISNDQIYLLDQYLKPVPIGVPGVIYISGVGLARGYLNNSQLTAEKFVAHPFLPGKRMYNTGDLARWLPDGNLEFLGRSDYQVKIRGHRIELGEIESRLLDYDKIDEVIVMDRVDETGSKYLCAYLVADQKTTSTELREHLAQNLPEYMIPSYIIQLDQMPLNQNGKIDRKELPKPEGMIVTRAEYEAPGNQTEESLVEIWKELLGVQQISIHDNFFDLGGHSLKATILAGKIHKEFNVEVSLNQIFKSPTIKGISTYIQSAAKTVYFTIGQVEEKEYYQVSSAQKRMYMLQQFDLQSISYNMPIVLKIEGDFNIEKVETAFQELIRRQEILRTSFRAIEDEIVQIINPKVEFAIEYIEVNQLLDDVANEIATMQENCESTSNSLAESIQKLVVRKAVKEFVRPFDLNQAPLLRLRILRFEENNHILMFDMHHITSDGTSMAILINEFTSLYEGKELVELNIQYKDYAEWQNAFLKSDVMKRQEEYWLNRFRDEVPVLNLPTDYSRSLIQSFEGKTLRFVLGQELTKGLKRTAKETGSTLYMVLLSGVNILLSKYSGQDDLVVGSPVAGRPHTDLEKMIGMFVNTLTMRNKVEGLKTYEAFLQEVKENALKAYENQDYQFEELVEQLNVRKDLSRSPLFDVFFSLQNMESESFNLSNANIIPYRFENSTSKFDISIIAHEIDGEIELEVEYCIKLFKQATIERVCSHLINIFKTVVANPKIQLNAISLLTEKEKDKILNEFNHTHADYPRMATLHKLFEEKIDRAPDQIAVMFGEQLRTYRELNEQANRLARTLRKKGIQADEIVGILVDRSIEMLVGIFAILKAGGAYLPITPEYSTERIQYLLEDSQTNMVLTSGKYSEKVEMIREVLDLDDENIYSSDGSNLESINKANNLAYVIYTSGSTGKPKGVVVEHQSVVNILSNLEKDYTLTEEDTYLLKTTYTFDVSVTEIFGWFMGHGRIAILTPGGEKELHTIAEAISRYNVTHINFVPSMLSVFLDGLGKEGLEKLQSLRYLFVAGEAFPKELLKKCRTKLPNVAIENIYGPTETTIYVTRYSTSCLEEESTVPIGSPLNNVRAYILDQSNNLLPIGVAGELCIAGECLARGYFNRPDLTGAKFVDDPFVLEEKMYKTGDLVRWLPDGNIEFLGRIDHQVKIRGFRIELGEIENCLLTFGQIKEAVVIARKDEQGDKDLCAYFVANREIYTGELREYLLKNLPEYMLPSFFIQLDKMPLNKNGKIDRNLLPEPNEMRITEVEYEVPRNEIEEKLASLWAEALNIGQVGIQDNFFELGGHSLKATLLTTRIHKELNVELPLREFFQRPTIKSLAQYIISAEENVYSSIKPVEKREFYPTSSAQKRLFVQNQFEGVGVSYNMPGAITIEGSLDREKFEQAFHQLVQRHETLRTSFEMMNDEVVQKIEKEVSFGVCFVVANENDDVQEMLNEFVHPFDLSLAPLLRIKLAKVAEDRHVMLFDMHHIISDGVSMKNLIREFTTLYQSIELAEIKIQYKDFAVWQNELFKTKAIQHQEKYWLDTFAGEIPVLNMPTDSPRPSIQSYKGSLLNSEIDEALVVQLRELAVQTGATLYMLMLAAYNLLLYKYTGQEDLVIGTPIAGRRHADLENIIGLFVNMLALRNTLDSDKTFSEFLSEVKKNTLLAFDHQDYQFEELVDKLNLRRDLSRNPLFDLVFSMQDATHESLLEIDDLRFIPYIAESNISKFDLTLEVIEETNGMWLSLEYCSDLFTKGMMERFSSHFVNILREISQNPEIKLAEVDMLSRIERKQLLDEFNATEMDYTKEKTLHELFADQVERTPEKIAVIFTDEKLTYRELNIRANQLADRLREFGVGRDEIIAIMAERSIDMIIGILAVLKTSGAYMPIDPIYPMERIIYMLEDSKARILLTHNGYADQVNYNGEMIDLTDRGIYVGDGHNLNNINQPNDLAYVMYTSGSTGKPKGVMIEHQGVVSLSKYYNEMFKLDQEKNILHLSNVSFDTSVVEIFPPLIYGATVYIIRKELALDRKKFIEFVQENQIHFAQFVPMMLQEILGQSEKPDSLETVIVGGDKLDDVIKDQILSLGYQLTNHYGPTENTVDAIVARCTKGKATIGKPIANTRAFILDKNNHLTPIGIPGELCISGVGLARGYLNRPKLTEEKFISNPFIPGERMYRTGDLACWQSDGTINFLGRIDNQVKIRGYRIELGEIELQLLKHQGVTGAIVLDQLDLKGSKYLCAYFVAEGERTTSELRGHLSKELPDYMIPSYFMQIEEIPLTYNGKVDRRALPKPDGGVDTGVEYEAPNNDVEEKLVILWQEILEIQGIGTKHNFFELGGHSLKATILVSKIHRDLNVEVPLSEIFKYPNIKELSQYIIAQEENLYSSIQSVEEKEYYPVSSAQRRLYILCQFKGVDTSIQYNMPGILTIEGILDRDRFEDAFCQLVDRHEALRTSFDMVDGEIVQKVHKVVEFEISCIESREEKTSEMIQEFIRPFDLSQAPLLRVGLVKLAKERHVLFFDMHHIISDGTSMDIFVKEFIALYQQLNLPELKIQYKDFSAWQNELFKTDIIVTQEKYWLNLFAGEIPVLMMPTDYPRPEMQSFDGASLSFELDEELTEKLKSLCKQTGTTLFMALLASYNILLSKYTRQKDIVVGTPVAGRPHADLHGIIGMFINTLAMRNAPVGSKGFKEFLQEVKKNALNAFENQDYQFEYLVDQLDLQRDLSRNPLFDTLFLMQSSDNDGMEFDGLKITPYSFDQIQTKVDLTLSAREVKGKIKFNLEYCTKLYKPETIEKMAGHLILILDQLLKNPEMKLSDVSLYSEEDKGRVLDRLQQTMCPDLSNDEETSEIQSNQIEADFDF